MKRCLLFVGAIIVSSAGFAQYGDYSVRVDVAGNGYAHYTEVYFEDGPPEPTYGWDACCDALLVFGNAYQPHVFTKVVAPPQPANNERLSINGLPHLFEPTDVPMGFNPGLGGLAQYTFTVKELYTLPLGVTVELEDLAQNYTQDLLLDSVYTTWSAPSDDENRFILHFNPSSVTEVPNEKDQNVQPDVRYAEEEVIIYGLGKLEAGSLVRLIDMYGRVVLEKAVVGDKLMLDRANYAQGSYVVEFVSDKTQSKTIKIRL